MTDPASPAPLAATDPGLELRDGVPVSSRFDDVYFSREDGLAETAHVFLDGCGLPGLWRDVPAGGRRHVTIAETGFGTGLNFLAAWSLWRESRPAGGVLHYVAVEGFPLSHPQLSEALSAFPRLADLAGRLAERYPDPATVGHHRIWFEEDRVCLTLVIGEAAEALAGLEARADAWFLDGFAPAKNPSMWRPAVLAQVARLSQPGTRLASFTAAGAVRRGLAEVGFAVQKRRGFGRKRDCIIGTFEAPAAGFAGEPWYAPPPPSPIARVAVIGAGIAGASTVRALARRGIETLWLDRHGRLAAEASGNPAGLAMARPTADGDIQGALSGAAFRYAVAQARALDVPIGGAGVLELAPDAGTLKRFETMAAADLLAPISTSLVDAAEASEIAGVALDSPALWHRRGGWIDPAVWTAALAGSWTPGLGAVARLEPVADGWALLDRDGVTLGRADAVVLAAANLSPGLAPAAPLPLEAIRGQITRLAPTPASGRLQSCIAFGGYLSPAIAGGHVAGATYTRGGFDPSGWPVPEQDADDRRTLGLFPAALTALFEPAPSVLGARAAIRAVTPDRQPIAGPLCDAAALVAAYGHLRFDARRLEGGPPPFLPGLFAVTGLGSRGLVTAPLMAELAVAQMLGEPWPVARDTAAAVHPNRFTIRDLKRRRI
ncbi:bifunctional tRNA (5-methylaminomethyl-2-thiouridine)(34)-methyltransferase MnmD/FAD-dependent 5-carboxymethylaminomethyl-2-thiouridine(34) oxidoreductase MnmC [Thalassobaculum sp. OXR-137]|uniref:bifunctional tRNA (5-methylaminomethyl-2-thiouridine)(34)-methyltransferase MnmD/FAD-dependent 5-carboxymethylaminomethyl-2-thiouridine(34) oxidoreductase MnmC n=1 Tax=Thalassobaculum sp. OXR-137 TaxID=3100173 RepID=UPI002AC8A2BE|nr:bifunctional tRNA (5-methylaminomethyl-2-thiouridine)(34)-methyltransferase MnmD/FAD-dependent 5-carboxymethylaminomethyl-2-thiouridine(34) oxidoreductase MnmC [Thalassobaculum sp. OXR-137]WPZ32525.1 bifunctional tRNA (5-methylaminomethyl-2-thiouridine)(34)-methyltransferase MnmD/FAD-dependent 5-carboxymethylaminomethyl-2-thiouridine(34) oxidoreductase MnmC [Thalassobaculum sp. OXR-137]